MNAELLTNSAGSELDSRIRSRPQRPSHGRFRWAKRLAKGVLRVSNIPWISEQRLVRDLEAIGIRRGGSLLVHSSLSAIGRVRGGAAAVISSLLAVLGPDGTLVMPAHTWKWANCGTREFDVRKTPSCTGSIAEAFRIRPDAVRSLHPTHSVAAIGRSAAELVAEHEIADTPCGLGTPYARLLDAGGQILLLGVSLRRNTCFHTVESLASAPYLMKEKSDEFTITGYDGRTSQVFIRMHAPAVACRFAEMRNVLLDEHALREHRVGKAPSMLIDGPAFRDYFVATIAADPTFLLRTR